MRFENRLPPEGINVSKKNPFVDLVTLSAAVFGAVAAFCVVAYVVASIGAQWLPFSVEKSVADVWLLDQPSLTEIAVNGDGDETGRNQSAEIEAELQSLADALAAQMALPEEVSVTVHYVDDDTVNALATLGGHIYMFRGLLERIPHENALAMVLAHEIAHVRHRDPIRHLGGALVVSLVIDGLLGTRAGLASALIGGTGDLVARGYSRDAEEAADEAALRALWRHYGHVGGAADLFDVFAGVPDPTEHRAFAFLRTHPLRTDRIKAVREMAGDQTWSTDGPLTTLNSALLKASEHRPATLPPDS